MKVKELIEQLQKLDPEWEVTVRGCDNDNNWTPVDYFTITGLDLQNGCPIYEDDGSLLGFNAYCGEDEKPTRLVVF